MAHCMMWKSNIKKKKNIQSDQDLDMKCNAYCKVLAK